MLKLEYEVQEHGWALAKISNEYKSVLATVSYLHDTLAELTESTLCLVRGSTEAKVVFMDEPGEYQLKLKKIDALKIEYKVLWFDDWESWGMHPSDKFEEVLSGICTVKRLKQQVTTVLWKIYKDLGEEKYKQLWCEHDFPTELYQKLNAA